MLPGTPIHGLYGMVDTSASPGRSHRAVAEALLAAGVGVLQLRMKGAADSEVESRLRELLPLCRAAGARLILNDRADLAARFDGVGCHLGQDDGDPRAARALLGDDRLLGWSTHTLQQVREAAGLGIDYVGFGPVFSAASKHLHPSDHRRPDEPVGLMALRAAVKATNLPVVAIGGITEALIPYVVAAGARAAAMLSAVTAASDPEAAAERCQAAFRTPEIAP